MATMRQMLEQRARLVTQMRAAQDEADDKADGAMTAEQSALFDAMKVALANLEDTMKRCALVEDAERRIALPTPAIIGGGRRGDNFEARAHEFSITRAIAAASGMDVDAGREREISRELVIRSGRTFQGFACPIQALTRPAERRDVITTTTPVAGPGGNLIQTLLDSSQYIDLLRAALCIRQLGARVLSGLISNVDIPRIDAPASVAWVAENTAVPLTNEAFDKISLRPHHCGAIVQMSRNMIQQASPDIEQIVRSDLAAVLARALDSAAIAGTGGVQPTGILNTSGIGTVSLGTNGGVMTYDAIADLVAQVINQNVQGSLAFLGNTATRQSLIKMTTTQNQPIGLPVIFEDYPQAWSNLVPSNGTKGSANGLSSLIFGDFSDLILGFWSEIDILVNPYADSVYAAGNVAVRAMMTADVEVRHPQSFAAITDIVTTSAATVTAAAA